MVMQAGKLDRRIVIERFTATTDPFGGEVQTWAPLATVWAQYLPGPGGERWRSSEVAAVTECRFIIRNWPAVTVKDRVIYKGRAYDIVDVAEIGRGVGQEISAKGRAD